MGQTLSPPPAPKLGDAARLAAALAKKARLGPHYGKVLFLIGGYIDAGHPTPSWSELAARSGLRRNTIRNAIGECERRGLLAVTRPGAPAPDRYELLRLRLPEGPARK